MKSARRRAREFALQGVYSWLLSANDGPLVGARIREIPGFNKADEALFDSILHGVINNEQSLKDTLQPLLDRPVRELSPVELAVLLIGTYEFAHHPETPYKVVLNEAIELAKTFGSSEGHKYVNGVLDRLAATLRAPEVQAQRKG